MVWCPIGLMQKTEERVVFRYCHGSFGGCVCAHEAYQAGLIERAKV